VEDLLEKRGIFQPAKCTEVLFAQYLYASKAEDIGYYEDNGNLHTLYYTTYINVGGYLELTYRSRPE
jgi:hypothetical protein